MKPDATDTYFLGHSDAETQRLILQHRIYAPITRRLFEAAGIEPGMTVLDIGSGAGDVAMLLADMVGPSGRVVGLDTNAEILATARARADAAGYGNITFQSGDVEAMDGERAFDAAVGRWILMYLPDPAAFIRQLAGPVRPGGIVAFNEIDLGVAPTTFPATETATKLLQLMVPPPGAPGPDVRIGTKLYRLFIEAGLLAPEMRLEAPVGGGPDWLGYQYMEDTAKSIVPAIARLMGVDAAALDAAFGLDKIASRLRAELAEIRGVQMLAPLVGAWSRKI